MPTKNTIVNQEKSKPYLTKQEEQDYIAKYCTLTPEDIITTEDDNATKQSKTGKIEEKKSKAIELYNMYKASIPSDSEIPEVTINIDLPPEIEGGRVKVLGSVSYKGNEYIVEDIKPKHIGLISETINKQALVRAKYATGATPSEEATIKRIIQLSNRFVLIKNKDSEDPLKPLDPNAYLYGGFVLSDKTTNKFIGMFNIGASDLYKSTEMATLNRAETWNSDYVTQTDLDKLTPYLPDVVTKYDSLPDEITSLEKVKEFFDSHQSSSSTKATVESEPLTMGDKKYTGVGTVETYFLVQYVKKLKDEGRKVLGGLGLPKDDHRKCSMEIPEQIDSTARTDNSGSWKAAAKSGFKVEDVDFKHQSNILRFILSRNI
ncbi:MAG: hypothetical protein ABSA84_03885 [Gammaproteobacteria bacterium]|jgi:hypothetical protein